MLELGMYAAMTLNSFYKILVAGNYKVNAIYLSGLHDGASSDTTPRQLVANSDR